MGEQLKDSYVDDDNLYYEEMRERQNLAKQAHYRHNAPKKPQINNYSYRRWIDMNGDTNSYNFSKPVEWREFKSWPDKIQFEYIKALVSKYSIGPSALGDMLGVTGVTVSDFMKSKFNYTFKRTTGEARKHFNAAFCNRTYEVQQDNTSYIEKDDIGMNHVPDANIAADSYTKVMQTLQAYRMKPPEGAISVNDASLCFSGAFDALTLADKLSVLITHGQQVDISIKITARTVSTDAPQQPAAQEPQEQEQSAAVTQQPAEIAQVAPQEKAILSVL